MATFKPFHINIDIACSMAQDLSQGRNVGPTLLEVSSIEKQVEKYIDEDRVGSYARLAIEKIKMAKKEAETKMVEVPFEGLKRKWDYDVCRIPKKIKVEETSEAKEEKENDVSIEELARRLKALPHKPTSLDAMNLIRSLGSYSAAQIEEAEILIGRKMKRVEEVWKLMIFIKFGFAKGENVTDARKLYKELLEKEKENKN